MTKSAGTTVQPNGRNLAVKIFLSHSSKDISAVVAFAEELQQHGYTVWWFEQELPFGHPIRNQVENNIRECDFFVLCHSANAVASDWVREELDLALSLEGAESCVVRVFKIDEAALSKALRRRDWATSREKDPSLPQSEIFYDCTKARCFDPKARTDSKANFIGGFAPRIEYYGYLGKGGDDIPEAFFDAYEDLFPDDEQRAPNEDTRGWINESNSEVGLVFRDLIVTLSIADKPVSFIYVTPYMTSGLVFGSYFGVLRKHRSKNYARIIYEDASLQLNRMYEAAFRDGNSPAKTGSFLRWLRLRRGDARQAFKRAPRPHGHLFEVEAIPLEDVERIVTKIEDLHLPRDPEHITNEQEVALKKDLAEDELALMRAAKRIAIYEANKCRAVLNPAREPMPYIQPALRAPLSPDNEVPMVVMYCPINTASDIFERDFLYNDIVSGFYLDWYKDANGKANEREIPGYVPYLENLRERVLDQAGQRFILGSLLSEPAKRLLALDRRYKLSGPL